MMMALRVAVLAYVGMCLFVFWRQASYVYYPTRQVEETPAGRGLAFEDLKLQTADGETIAAWFVPAADPAARTLLICHGNGGNIGHRTDALKEFHDLGFNALIFDYRGYGGSTGKPTERGTYADAMAAWDYLTRERGIASTNIVVFGRSLGGAVATWLAGQVHPRALVVEATFTSIPDMARQVFPYLPTRWLCRIRYDTAEMISRVSCPVMVVHSRNDEMVPFEHGRRLFAAAREPKRFLELNSDHNATEVQLTLEYRKALGEVAELRSGRVGE